MIKSVDCCKYYYLVLCINKSIMINFGLALGCYEYHSDQWIFFSRNLNEALFSGVKL